MSQHFVPGRRGLVAVRADASGDPKAIFAELQGAFQAFKTEHTEQLNEIRSGVADVVKAEKVDRINADVSKLQQSLDKAMTDIAALKVGGNGGDDRRPGDPEYVKDFEAYFRDGEISAKVKASKVQAAANKGTPGQGGYLAPIEWDRTITDRLVDVSPMRQIAGVQAITSAGYTKLYNMRGAGSGWVGETAARPETTTPTLAPITITPGTIYAMPAATEEILEDAEIDIEAWLTNEVETEFAYQEALAFIAGNGTNKPAGFLSYVTGGVNAAAHPYGAIPQEVAVSATAITADEIISLVYSLPTQNRMGARFVMNLTTIEAIRKLKDGQGNYLWQPTMTEGQPAQLAGYPITEMAGMPDPAAAAFPVAFGDFRRGYLIVDRRGVTVLRDPYSAKPYVLYYMTKRVGGAVVDPDVLRVLKMAAA